MIGDPRDSAERSLNTPIPSRTGLNASAGSWNGSSTSTTSPTGRESSRTTCPGRAKLSAIEFLRDVGKHFLGQRDVGPRPPFRRRLEAEGISYTEFSYMLLQANDYVELHRLYGTRVADRRIGSVGKHHRRRATGPPETRGNGARHDRPTGDGSRTVRSSASRPAGGRSLARPGDDQPVRVLYQYFVNTADADVVNYLRWSPSSPPTTWPNWSTPRRAAGRPTRAGGRAPAGPGVHHVGARSGRDECGGTRQSGAVRAGELNRNWTRRRSRPALRGGVPSPNSTGADPDAITDLLVAAACRRARVPARTGSPSRRRRLGHNTRSKANEWVPQPADSSLRQVAGSAPGKRNSRRCGARLDDWYDRTAVSENVV